MDLIQAYRGLIDCGHINLFLDPKVNISFCLQLTTDADIYSCIIATCHQWKTPEIVSQNGDTLARCYRNSGNKWSFLPRYDLIATGLSNSTNTLIPLTLGAMQLVNARQIVSATHSL